MLSVIPGNDAEGQLVGHLDGQGDVVVQQRMLQAGFCKEFISERVRAGKHMRKSHKRCQSLPPEASCRMRAVTTPSGFL